MLASHDDRRVPVYEHTYGKRCNYDFKKDEHYQTTGATLGWALASVKVTKDIFKHINNIKIPIDIFTAGQDHLINPAGYDMFKEMLPQTRIHAYNESRHEIFNADEATRKRYYTEVLEVLNGK